MEFIKKYFLLIVPMGAAIIFMAVSWLLVSTSLAKLDKQMKGSAGKLQEIASANMKVEAVVSQEGAKAVMTPAFPNAANFAAWDERYKTIQKELTSLHDKVQQFNWGNRKEGLPPANTLPKMNTGGFERYKEWYRNKMRELVKSLNPTWTPSLEQIRAEFNKLKEKNKVNPEWKMGIMPAATGAPAPGQPAGGGVPGAEEDTSVWGQKMVTVRGTPDEAQKLTKEAEENCNQQQAQNGRIYVKLGDLTVSEIYSQAETANEVQLWYAQMEYWVQSDVVEAIRRVNDKAAEQYGGQLNVFSAPVKQLIGITVSNYVLGPGGAVQTHTPAVGTESGGYPATPAQPLPPIENLGPGGSKAKLSRPPVIRVQSADTTGRGGASGEQNPLDDIFMSTSLNPTGVHSPTGHYTSDLFGVVYVTTQVVVDSRKVMDVMDALCKMNLYTILSVRLDPVPEALRERGFIYGEAPVTLLTFQAELLMFHEFYRTYMPREIQQMLLIEQPPAAGGTAGVGGAGQP